jgi:hypothetical protein
MTELLVEDYKVRARSGARLRCGSMNEGETSQFNDLEGLTAGETTNQCGSSLGRAWKIGTHPSLFQILTDLDSNVNSYFGKSHVGSSHFGKIDRFARLFYTLSDPRAISQRDGNDRCSP